MECFRILNDGLPLGCTLNPSLGREFEWGDEKLVKNGAGRTVAVVGGGPAGFEAALTLAKRGFKVVLFETKNRIGGGTVGNPIYHIYTAPRNIDMQYYRDNYAIPDSYWMSELQSHFVENPVAEGYIRQSERVKLSGPMMNYPYMDARQNNPYWLLNQNQSTHRDDRVYGGFQGNLDIWGGISLQARYNFDHTKYREEGCRYATTFAPASM